MYIMSYRYVDGAVNFKQCDSQTLSSCSDYNHIKITPAQLLKNKHNSLELSVGKPRIPKQCFTGFKSILFHLTFTSIASLLLPGFNVKGHHSSTKDLLQATKAKND